MLSTTHSRDDVKSRLNSQYTDYGFTASGELNTAVDTAIDTAMITFMYPAITSDEYAVISALDKVGLTESQRSIYEAEVRLSLYVFLKETALKEQQKKSGTSTSYGQTGTSSSSSGRSGKDSVAGEYYRQGLKYLNAAGYYKSTQVFRDGMSTDWRTAEDFEDKSWE